MRLSDEYKLITEELVDLYQYKEFIGERVITLERKLAEMDRLIEFVDYLDAMSESSPTIINATSNNEGKYLCNSEIDFQINSNDYCKNDEIDFIE